MLTFFELAHILDATLLCFSCVHKHVDVTHLMHINMPRSFLSNILDATPVMGWGEYVNIRTCTHQGCYATAVVLST